MPRALYSGSLSLHFDLLELWAFMAMYATIIFELNIDNVADRSYITGQKPI